MADFIRTIESDLFGAYEWAAELYEELADAPEAPDRLAVHRGLLRCYEGLDGRAAEAMRAAEGLVEAEEALDDTERDVLAPLEAPREQLFANGDAPSAAAFLAAFDALWGGHANKQALVPDAILAGLAHSNVLGATRSKSIPPEEAKAHHVRAAQLYEELYAMFTFRVGTGEPIWKETMQQCIFRASVAWRFAGDDARSKRATEIGGPVPDAASLVGKGLR